MSVSKISVNLASPYFAYINMSDKQVFKGHLYAAVKTKTFVNGYSASYHMGTGDIHNMKQLEQVPVYLVQLDPMNLELNWKTFYENYEESYKVSLNFPHGMPRDLPDHVVFEDHCNFFAKYYPPKKN